MQKSLLTGMSLLVHGTTALGVNTTNDRKRTKRSSKNSKGLPGYVEVKTR